MRERNKENQLDEIFYGQWFELICRKEEIERHLPELRKELANAKDIDKQHDLDSQIFELEHELESLRDRDKKLIDAYKSYTAMIQGRQKPAKVTNSRYDKAREFSIAYAKREWADGSSLRPGEIARHIYMKLGNGVEGVPLQPLPTFDTITDWIKNLVPEHIKGKPGRPKKIGKR